MASQSSYSRSGNRSYHPSLTSVNTADQFGNTREMGPPPDFPPQPVEIDLNISRTLPTPSAFVSAAAWDASTSFQQGSFGDYGPSIAARSQQIPVDSQTQGQHDPLRLWYSANDGPWVPRDALPEDLSHSKHAGNRIAMSYGGQYRQPNPSEAGSYQVGIPPSDSGYGTRKSVANTSVFSGDFPDRDQDCHSLVGHVQDFQPFQSYSTSLQPQDVRTAGSWTSPSVSNPSDIPRLTCPTCHQSVKTQSDLKKHHLRHTKPFHCGVEGCSRTEGFSTRNDLERHVKSKHPAEIPETAATKKYRCHVPGCKSKEKSWPRLDNFRSHLKRVHSNHFQTEEQFEDMIRSGEHWERTTGRGSEVLPQTQRNLEVPQTRPLVEENLPVTRLAESWNDLSTGEESNLFLSSARRGQFNAPPTRMGVPPQRSPLPEEPQQTVQPLEVYPYGRAPESSVRLDRVHSAPVSLIDSTRKSDDADHQPPRRSTTDEATRQTGEKDSALEATMTEVLEILTAAAPDGVVHNTNGRNPLPDGKVSPPNSWSVATETALPAIDKRAPNGDLTDRTVTSNDPKAPQVSEKALEVFKALASKLGFTIQKEPSQPPSPKIQNAGSVASNKSEHQVKCEVCKKFKGRPCELRKHMKRHERPYGCTFQTCKKSFGSKNDWKRHENSQHFHLETWRCGLPRPGGGDTPCAKVCYRRQTFQEHLKKEHQMSIEKDVNDKADACRIGRNCQARFWCGFCKRLIDLKKKGLDAWTERFDHIDDHFMGRNESDGCKKWNINDWVPVDGDKPAGEGEASLSMANGFSGKNSPSSEDSSSGSSAHPVDVEGTQPLKRKFGGSSDDDRSHKHKQPRSNPRVEKRVVCCLCNEYYNLKINDTCINDSHRFEGCNSCKIEHQPPPEEKI